MKIPDLLSKAGRLARKKSVEGYSRGIDGPSKLILSPYVTMKVPGIPELLGTPYYKGGGKGRPVLMRPGRDYYFPGAQMVKETPVYQQGGNFVSRGAENRGAGPSLYSDTLQELFSAPVVKNARPGAVPGNPNRRFFEVQKKRAYTRGKSEQLKESVMPLGYESTFAGLKKRYEQLMDRAPKSELNKDLVFDHDEQGRPIYFNIPRREDAWSLYLGLDQQNNSFEPSGYTPGVSKEDSYYVRPSYWTDRHRQKLLDKALQKRERYGAYDKDALKKDSSGNLYFTANERTHVFDWKTGDKEGYDPVAFSEEMIDNPLGDFKVSFGKDEHGDYLSIYDKWDLHPLQALEDGLDKIPFGKNTEASKIAGAGHPFEIYDRLYYTPDGKLKKPGGQKHKKGGQVPSLFKKGGKNKAYKGSGTKDACYHKVKSRYTVWPSAYASGALSQCRKTGAENWGEGKEQEGGRVPLLFKEGGTFDKEKKEGLRGWFGRNDGKGWIDCKTGKPCGRQEGEKRKSYPACRPTKAACNKYKPPKGKASPRAYDWEKKASGGAFDPPEGKNLYALIDKMVELSGNKYTRGDFLDLLDKVSLVESGDRNIAQIGGGPGFGHYQIEGTSFATNNRRLENFMEETGLEIDYPFPEGPEGATKEQQAMNALMGMWKTARAKGTYIDPTDPENTWLDYHWIGSPSSPGHARTKEARREHFRSMVQENKGQ